MRAMSETLAIELGLARVSEAPLLARMSRDYIEARPALALADARRSAGSSSTRKPSRCAPGRRHCASRIAATPSPYRDGDVLGFGIMTYGLETAHLMLLAVQPRARRRNIAVQSLDWLEETAITAAASIASNSRCGPATRARVRSIANARLSRTPLPRRLLQRPGVRVPRRTQSRKVVTSVPLSVGTLAAPEILRAPTGRQSGS
jgi:GNAT superfamily N-acetyltransferase